jgi:hypothetical protein
VNKIPVDRGRLSAATPSDLPLDQERKIPSTLMTSIVYILISYVSSRQRKRKTIFFGGVFHAAISDERQIWNFRQVSRSESEGGGVANDRHQKEI